MECSYLYINIFRNRGTVLARLKRVRLSRCFCVLASVAVLCTAVEAKTKMEGKAFSLMSLFNKKRHFVEVPYGIN